MRLNLKKVCCMAFAAVMAVALVNLVPAKKASADNPIVQHIFAPDPAPMVYNDTLYLYTTHDEDETQDNFYTMLNWHCFSTKDMVNWTAHGQIWSLDDISWANDRAWAAQCVEKDGKFYLYVPVKANNSGICIGVGVSDSPTGPFEDAIGGPLVDEGDWNDIDPTVFIDDDGQAYLYFGNPELRYVKLNDDMISYDKSLGVVKQEMTAEAFGEGSGGRSCSYAEGPWLYKRNDLYYMVYPAFGKTGGENISYSTSTSPTGPWTYRGVVLAPNNCYTIHPGVIDYKGHSYMFYHGNPLDKSSSYHRSTCLEEFTYNDDGSISQMEQTKEGVQSVQNLNPYERVEAETIAWERGIDIENRADGGCNVRAIHDGNYIKVKDVDFGDKSPLSVSVNVACASEAQEGTIEFCIDCDEDILSEKSNDTDLFGEGFDLHNTDVDSGEVIAYADVKSTGGEDVFQTIEGKIEKEITGVHDLYIVFRSNNSDELFKFDYWQFEKAPEPTPDIPSPSQPSQPSQTSNPSVSVNTPEPVVTSTPDLAKPAKVKKLVVKKKGNKVVVSWKKVNGAKKYQVVYSTDKKLKKGVKKITVKTTKCTIKKLKSKKTYYFKVRAYAGNEYGKYSAKKKIKL